MTAVQLNFDDALVVAVGGASAQSAAFALKSVVRVTTTTACWIKAGTNPTAVADTSGNFHLPANGSIDLILEAGYKIAVIQDAGAGHLCIAPIIDTRG